MLLVSVFTCCIYPYMCPFITVCVLWRSLSLPLCPSLSLSLPLSPSLSLFLLSALCRIMRESSPVKSIIIIVRGLGSVVTWIVRSPVIKHALVFFRGQVTWKEGIRLG